LTSAEAALLTTLTTELLGECEVARP